MTTKLLPETFCVSHWSSFVEINGNLRLLHLRIGRGEMIRTSDPLHPMQVRYQAALRPDRSLSLYQMRLLKGDLSVTSPL